MGETSETKINRHCRCGAQLKLVVTQTRKFNPTMGPAIIGPGGQKQWYSSEHRKVVCPYCALLYDFDTIKQLAEEEKP